MKEVEYDDPRAAQTRRMADDGCVFEGHAYVHWLSVACSSGGAGETEVYDGIDTTGEQIMDIASLASTTFQYQFIPPMLVHKGLYLALSAHLTSITVRFRALRD